jgi:hypothetical protein
LQITDSNASGARVRRKSESHQSEKALEEPEEIRRFLAWGKYLEKVFGAE